ncbi:hypothetical protein CEW83_04990 [Parazoarcus communis]|uniref:Uncharacterized protein n=2 Tax=Parazoarcus communis TaxID=41977 RepID=A0A2U8GLY5_9RHOO|nr:hypothetical protein CEW83_04990 [Parazoarcus communis]
MKVPLITGFLRVVMGAAMLVCQTLDNTTTEEVLRIGPVAATAEQMQTDALLPLIGWLLVGGGEC